MKVQKYIFLLHHAIEKVSKRFDIEQLSPATMFVLYTIQYLPFNCNQQGIIRHAKRMKYPIAQATISLAITYLVSVGLVEAVDGRLSLAPRGREYLSAIRRFLVNKRL